MSFKDKIFNNQSPWGSSPSGGSDGNGSGTRREPPNIDDIIKNFQKTINKFTGGGKSSGGKPIILGLIILIVLWTLSGLYRVLPDEQGVVMRFGKFIKTTQPGLNYHLPLPIERALTPKVTKVNRIDVGFRPASDSGRSSSGFRERIRPPGMSGSVGNWCSPCTGHRTPVQTGQQPSPRSS